MTERVDVREHSAGQGNLNLLCAKNADPRRLVTFGIISLTAAITIVTSLSGAPHDWHRLAGTPVRLGL